MEFYDLYKPLFLLCNEFMEKIDYKYIIPLILIVIIIAGGFYWYNQNKEENQNAQAGQIGLDADLGDSVNSTTTSQEYSTKINEIRTKVNKDFEDLASKAKYTTLFSSDEITNLINQTKIDIADGINQLQSLKLDSTLVENNQKQLQSLNLLAESIDAFSKYRVATDQTEAQKQYELYQYDIEQSNKIIQSMTNN